MKKTPLDISSTNPIILLFFFFIFPFIYFGCAFGPISSHETARTIGKEKSQVVFETSFFGLIQWK